jgi:hypothetical protein
MPHDPTHSPRRELLGRNDEPVRAVVHGPMPECEGLFEGARQICADQFDRLRRLPNEPAGCGSLPRRKVTAPLLPPLTGHSRPKLSAPTLVDNNRLQRRDASPFPRLAQPRRRLARWDRILTKGRWHAAVGRLGNARQSQFQEPGLQRAAARLPSESTSGEEVAWTCSNWQLGRCSSRRKPHGLQISKRSFSRFQTDGTTTRSTASARPWATRARQAGLMQA